MRGVTNKPDGIEARVRQAVGKSAEVTATNMNVIVACKDDEAALAAHAKLVEAGFQPIPHGRFSCVWIVRRASSRQITLQSARKPSMYMRRFNED